MTESSSTTCCLVLLCTSTTGVSPVTVMVSCTPPTRRSALIVITAPLPLTSTPSRLTTEKPVRVNVSEYGPGGSSASRYWPVPSVTAVRTFSIRTGLEASTVTPGSTAPGASRTTPVSDDCARASAGTNTQPSTDNRLIPPRNHRRESPGINILRKKVNESDGNRNRLHSLRARESCTVSTMRRRHRYATAPEVMRNLIAIALAGLATFSTFAQPTDPKRAFTEALGRFSVALSGRFADDGSRITSSLVAMDEALARWDDAMRRSRAAADALIEKSSGAAAARVRVATALTLAERGLTSEAIGLLNEAITQSPRDVDALTVLGLIHTQLAPNATAAGSAFRQAVAGDPGAPLQRYLLAKYLADQGATDDAAAVGLALRTDTRPADGPDRAPFVRIHLIPELPGIEPFFPPDLYAQAFVMLAQADYQTALGMLHAAA